MLNVSVIYSVCRPVSNREGERREREEQVNTDLVHDPVEVRGGQTKILSHSGVAWSPEPRSPSSIKQESI